MTAFLLVSRKIDDMKILEMPGAERPRERLLEVGPQALSGAELLAVLLRTGSGGKNGESALETAAGLIAQCNGDILALSGMSAQALRSIRGIGTAKAATLLAAFELGRRFMEAGSRAGGKRIGSAVQAYEAIVSRLKGKTSEECWVMYLSRSGKLIRRERITEGDGNSTIVDTQRIIRMALECAAASLILAHNHPSGNPRPSAADVKNTKMLHDAASSFGIDLLDHIIVCDSGFYSFSEEKNYFIK